MNHVSTNFPPPTVSALLDDGAWVLGQNQRTREQTARLAQETRELILTSRPHRFHPIAGADYGTDDEGRIRRKLRAFATSGTPKTFVGESRGATCDACGRKIFVGEIEYEVVANGLEMRMESDCYLLLVDELEKLPRSDDGS